MHATVDRPIRKTSVLLLGIPDWMSPKDITKEVVVANENPSKAPVQVKDNPGGCRVVHLEVRCQWRLRCAWPRSGWFESAGVGTV